jgi:hypothetical protein
LREKTSGTTFFFIRSGFLRLRLSNAFFIITPLFSNSDHFLGTTGIHTIRRVPYYY